MRQQLGKKSTQFSLKEAKYPTWYNTIGGYSTHGYGCQHGLWRTTGRSRDPEKALNLYITTAKQTVFYECNIASFSKQKHFYRSNPQLSLFSGAYVISLLDWLWIQAFLENHSLRISRKEGRAKRSEEETKRLNFKGERKKEGKHEGER